MSKVSLSVKKKGRALDLSHLPKSIGETLHRLTSDTDSAIAASALRTMAVLKRTIMEQSPHAEAKKDTDQRRDSLAALAKVIGGMNNPFFPFPSL